MWYLFGMQGMFAILKLFLFAIKVIMDQEQSNERSPSRRWRDIEMVCPL